MGAPPPSARDRQIKPGLVFGWIALLIVQKWLVDQLDEDAAVLRRLDGVGDVDQLASGFIGIAARALSGEFHGTMSCMSARLNLTRRILILWIVARLRAAGSILANRSKSAAISGA